MDTPILDFVRSYCASSPVRLHMPGHKGTGMLGMEALDITEITGADSLYEASGIIRRSEENASALFGCPTFYSTEGSSQCIRAMLYLLTLYAGGKAVIAAARNVHKSFLSAAALLDLDVRWIESKQSCSYLSCPLTAGDLEDFLQKERPTAVYLTSPDYLGNVADIAALSQVCHRYGVLLAVDAAHGAYLRFLQPSRHPMDLGADLCCASAHKTLPALTGAAYLHIAPNAPALFHERAKDALALFGSTSPSYLILRSLDGANRTLSDHFSEKLADLMVDTEPFVDHLEGLGWSPRTDEPLKLTLRTKPMGYTGLEVLAHLHDHHVECEYADPDHLVMMLAPGNGRHSLERAEQALRMLPRRAPITDAPPAFAPCEPVMSIRQAMFSPSRTVPIGDAEGQILASPGVSCPPAVPIVVCGQRIGAAAIRALRYYGIEKCTVVIE